MLMTYLVNFRQMNDHLSGKELFIRFAARVLCNLLSIYVFSHFPFGFDSRIWYLIVSVLDHCLSFYPDRKGKHLPLQSRCLDNEPLHIKKKC